MLLASCVTFRGILGRIAPQPRRPIRRHHMSSPKNGIRQPNARARTTNGSVVLPNVDGRTLWVRRLYDLIASITQDMGGDDAISESERSIIRRIATQTVAMQKLEAQFTIKISAARREEAGPAPAPVQHAAPQSGSPWAEAPQPRHHADRSTSTLQRGRHEHSASLCRSQAVRPVVQEPCHLQEGGGFAFLAALFALPMDDEAS